MPKRALFVAGIITSARSLLPGSCRTVRDGNSGYLRCMARSVTAVAAFALLNQGVQADEFQSLSACKAEFAGDLAISNCLSLDFEESEVALSGLEESFLSVLSDAYPGDKVSGAGTGALPVGSTSESSQPEDELGKQVIAIIGGVATPVKDTLRSVPAQGTDRPAAAAPGQLREALIESFQDEPDEYRGYRNSRCSWMANIDYGIEADWREIACRTQMNLERSAELREQMDIKLQHSTRPDLYRGELLISDNLPYLQPCASTVRLSLIGPEQLLASVSVAASASESSYIEVMAYQDNNALRMSEILRVRERHEDDCRLETGALASAEVQSPTDAAAESSASNGGNVEQSAESPATQTGLAALALAVQGSDADETTTSLSQNTPATDIDDEALSGFFQSWVASCRADKEICTISSSAETASTGSWMLQIVADEGDERRLELVPAAGQPIIGRDIGVYIDKKPVGNRRLKSRETRLQAGRELMLFDGQDATEMLRNMRRGRIIKLAWLDRAGDSQELTFSLYGLRKSFAFIAEQSQ